jgi:hypothetical protein
LPIPGRLEPVTSDPACSLGRTMGNFVDGFGDRGGYPRVRVTAQSLKRWQGIGCLVSVISQGFHGDQSKTRISARSCFNQSGNDALRIGRESAESGGARPGTIASGILQSFNQDGNERSYISKEIEKLRTQNHLGKGGYSGDVGQCLGCVEVVAGDKGESGDCIQLSVQVTGIECNLVQCWNCRPSVLPKHSEGVTCLNSAHLRFDKPISNRSVNPRREPLTLTDNGQVVPHSARLGRRPSDQTRQGVGAYGPDGRRRRLAYSEWWIATVEDLNPLAESFSFVGGFGVTGEEQDAANPNCSDHDRTDQQTFAFPGFHGRRLTKMHQLSLPTNNGRCRFNACLTAGNQTRASPRDIRHELRPSACG